MSDALPLPPRPNLEQYKKLAKDFQRACKSGQPDAIRDWAIRWAEKLAQLQGLEITPEVRRQIDHEGERVKHHWQKFQKTNERATRCLLSDAQFFVARGHGFASWPKFVKHLEGLARAGSPISKFEAAVEAIITGDGAKLKKLLRAHPELVRARSTREHRSTLLHYVSANGVEDFRQKTPKNIVEITKLLLEAGADVNAESDAYAGRSTTLGLAATSCHPEDAGVQLPLLDLLLQHGAAIDGPDGGKYSAGAEILPSAVNGCLHNGRGEAAVHLASRGARLDLEGAAGVGRLDIVKNFFKEDGKLKPTATPQQMQDGFAWACEFGRREVVDYLLQRGMDVKTKFKHDGQTGLHWAAFGGHPETVKLLLERGAPVEVKDDCHNGTPLDWALYAWGGGGRGRYYEVVALLIRAGAKLDPAWYEDDLDRQRAARTVRADPQMQAALRGELPR